MSDLKFTSIFVGKLDPKAQPDISQQWDLKCETFNSMCYVLSHYAILTLWKIRETICEKWESYCPLLSLLYQWTILTSLFNPCRILSSLFSVIYYTASLQFSIISKNSLYYLQKINRPDNTTLSEIKFFWPNITDVLLIFFSPSFGRCGTCHDITISADSQINNKIFRQWQHDCRILRKGLSIYLSRKRY